MYLALPGMYSDWRCRVMMKNTPNTEFVEVKSVIPKKWPTCATDLGKDQFWNSPLPTRPKHYSKQWWVLIMQHATTHYSIEGFAHVTFFIQWYAKCYFAHGWHHHDPGRHRYELTLVVVLGFWAWKINNFCFCRGIISRTCIISMRRNEKKITKNLYLCFLKWTKHDTSVNIFEVIYWFFVICFISTSELMCYFTNDPCHPFPWIRTWLFLLNCNRCSVPVCEDCELEYPGDCPVHGSLFIVADTKVKGYTPVIKCAK